MKKRSKRDLKRTTRFGNQETLEPRNLLASDIELVSVIEPDDAAHGPGCGCPGCGCIPEMPGHWIGDGHDHSLRVDSFGNQFYFDPAPELTDVLVDDGGFDDGPVADGGLDVPNLHSNPSATQKIFLDFDGQVVSGTAWNQYNNNNPIHAPAYSTDNDIFSFSSAELSNIEQIWQRVSEDFAPFDVDVTTEDPGVDAFTAGREAIRVIISTDRDDTRVGGTGNRWFSGAGGVAFLNSFNWTTDTPVWVFENNLGNSTKNITEAATHEAGHAFGLSHDGNNSTAYYAGHGTGTTGWAPIMGVGYNRNVTQWSKGDYANANNRENDLNVLRSDLGYRVDDHSGSTNNVNLATPVSIVGSSFSASGIIEQSTDVDVFSIVINGGGNLTISAEAFTPGPNLDIEMTIYDSTGVFVDSNNPLGSLDASLSLNGLSGGTYLVAIDGVGTGSPVTGYNDYASLGRYTIEGNLTVTGNNSSPVAQNDFYDVDEDETLTGPNLLANDNDADLDALSVNPIPVADVSNGRLTLNPDGTFEYIPDDNYNGTDFFTYRVEDGNGGFDTANVTITIDPVNDDPTAMNDGPYAVVQQGIFTATLGIDDLLRNDTDVDGDDLFVLPNPVSGPANGELILSANGTFVYEPNPTFSGEDSFVYEIIDDNGGSATATATISVTPLGTSCDLPMPGGTHGDGFSDLFYNPVTGLMTLRVDSDNLPGDSLNAVLITGPEADSQFPPGSPNWGISAYFSGQMQLLLPNNSLFEGVETDAPLLQYATGLSAGDFGCVSYGILGDANTPPVTRYTTVAIATDTAAPVAAGTAADVTTPGASSHTVTVTFSDNEFVEQADVETGIIRVTGPNGYDEVATLLNVTPGADAVVLSATFSIPAAGGTWDLGDEGAYSIVLEDFVVTDTSNNFAAGGVIGSFQVNFSASNPGDFDNDGDLDCDDIDELSSAIASGSSDNTYDLNGSGTVSVADLEYWVINLKGTLLGDANLDFTVDGGDFLAWNTNKFQDNQTWCTGDFNADGTADGSDFLIWNSNKFQSAVILAGNGQSMRSAAAALRVDALGEETGPVRAIPQAAPGNQQVFARSSDTRARSRSKLDDEATESSNVLDAFFADLA